MSAYKLATPIKAYGEEVTEITLREATTADARAIGSLPYAVVGEDGAVQLALAVCAKYISRLAGIPLSAVDQIPLADFHAMAWEVAQDFLAQGQAVSKA
ncbi:phage tail assembly protein [Castellaniella sp. UC4442_H9]